MKFLKGTHARILIWTLRALLIVAVVWLMRNVLVGWYMHPASTQLAIYVGLALSLLSLRGLDSWRKMIK